MNDMVTPQQKGASLELAVHAIENAILRSSPAYGEKTFRIEVKKIVVVAGVRHEIDIWVMVDLGGGYEALFIFECKNWAERVGKNELIVFSEKIRALQAQRGFFVARSFTADAEAQAAQDARITLLPVSDLPSTDVPIPGAFHGISVEGTRSEAAFIVAGASDDANAERVDVGTATLLINGVPVAIEQYVNEWNVADRDKRVNSFPSQAAEEGVHELAFESERLFEPHAATLNGQELARIRLRGRVQVRVVRPKIISHFQVATRGRALTVALDLGEADVKVAFVALPTATQPR